ncbi:glucoamylase family protein [Rubripirellula tenax]|nr:glucoamylase family protein [Rubripirellula tenax]
MKRRTFLGGGLSLPLVASQFLRERAMAEPMSSITNALSGRPANDADRVFLDDLERRCYRYFADSADSGTGLIPDRGSTDGSWFSKYASSAACGFGLTAHTIAADRGFITQEEAVDRVRLLLRSLLNIAEHQRGFVYHFFSCKDGKRRRNSEASSIDTALMIAGAMCAASTFHDDLQIVEMANQLYERVDWTWMLGTNDLLHMGWTPEGGMLPYQWDSYSELILLVLLAIGAPNNPIPPKCWQAWRREPVLRFDGEDFLSYPPLFVHQYPMAYFDFRNVRSPSGRSYWDNSVRAHRAQIAFMTELAARYPNQFGHYGADVWGLTSSDSAHGYRDWGGPYQVDRFEPDRGIDGTVVPSAAAGGLAVLPNAALHTLRFQHERYGEKVYGRYGFVNAFNPVTGWIGADVIGIDTGISLAMANNLETGGVWQAFMRHPAATRALQLAGFTRMRS